MNLESEKKYNWAIIRRGDTKKIISIKLTDWNKWEWEDFATIKKAEKIAWFKNQELANNFIIKNFKEHEIDDEIIKNINLPRGFNW